MLSALSAILPAPVTPVASGGLGVLSGEARLGNLPTTTIAPGIATPDLQSQNRGNGQAKNNAAPETAPGLISASLPAASAASSLPVGGSSSFFAQLIGQSGAGDFAADGSLPVLNFENLQVENPVKYMPSNAFAPPPPSPRELFQPPVSKAGGGALPELPASLADAIAAARATVAQGSAPAIGLAVEKALPVLASNRASAVERAIPKISTLKAAPQSLVLPRGVEAYAASSARSADLLAELPELKVAV